MLCSGIDLHKRLIVICTVNADAIDAHTLAQLLCMGFVPEAHQLPPEYRATRDLLRQRMVMEHKRTNLMLRITSMLAKFNITEVPIGPSHSGFADFLGECTIPEQYRMTILMYHQQCLQVTEHKKQLEYYFKAQLRPTAALQLLASIPGIGDITGAIIAMETGNINRFADAKQYCSYGRLAPGARDSGGKHSHRSGSKDGNQYLKYAFTEATIKAMMYLPGNQTVCRSAGTTVEHHDRSHDHCQRTCQDRLLCLNMTRTVSII
jgi:transposase